MNMTPSKPYLIRALYEWILDNNCTPYVTVDTIFPNVSVPTEYIQDNSITLDISPSASSNLLINNETLTCSARFGGVAVELYIPIPSITAIFSQETSQGMGFPKEDYETSINRNKENTSSSEEQKSAKPKLKIISGGKKK